ncbi:MAG: hypothetical protein N3I86_07435 [Verrucomicrobiae bacterium]|nr:hypothetical protein [Verrucomicrobiae bacterium]MDW8310790.1 hypothetical protein [Verrucomicrobiales bacterium]
MRTTNQCRPFDAGLPRAWLVWIVAVLLVAPGLCGCVSRSKARARAAAAFAAGQRQAFDEVTEARRVNIRVLGPVRYSEVLWEDGLTLAAAIVAADYTLPGEPRAIYIIRQRERVLVEPQRLLRGEDFALEPGDTIEIQP